MATEQLTPADDIVELTIGADDVDLVTTYKRKACWLQVISGTGTLVLETVNSKAAAATKSLTVAAGWNPGPKGLYVTKLLGTGNGTSSNIKVQLLFNQ